MAPSDFPALLDVLTRTYHPLRGKALFSVGRSESADLQVLDVSTSRNQCRLVEAGGAYNVEQLSLSNPTMLDGRPLGQSPLPLRHEAELRIGGCRLQYLERPVPGVSRADRPQVSPRAAEARPVPAAPPRPAPLPEPLAPRQGPPPIPRPGAAASPPPIPHAAEGKTVISPMPRYAPEPVPALPLTDDQVIGRQRGQVHLALEHPHVSRKHARIWRRGGEMYIYDMGSANGTFVNGHRINTPTRLELNDQIDIGPFSLVFLGTVLAQPESREDNVELVGRNLSRTATDEKGNRKVLLDDISLVIKPGEFACILGPSGAGKSTLLNALSFRAPADRVAVSVNGKDLYGNFESLKQDLVLVPQQVVIHEALTVEQALWYTAKFRLPPDTERDELARHIDNMLDLMGMQEHRGKLIRVISGGQQKRAALANELISQPSLVFLDEVTSGLDEYTDLKLMQLFRRIADKGKTVVCITHSLANVQECCNLVVVLAVGGRVAFIGTPDEAMAYFGIKQLGKVYQIIDPEELTPDLARRFAIPWSEVDPETKRPDGKQREKIALYWQGVFKASPYYRTYLTDRLPRAAGHTDAIETEQAPKLSERFAEFFRQSRLLLMRNVRLMTRDLMSLGFLVVQAALIALLLGMVFGDLTKATDLTRKQNTVFLFFLLQISCFWFGCNNAAKEIVKERHIYARERDFNLQLLSYYGAKLLLLGVITALQVGLLWACVAWYCKPEGSAWKEGAFLIGLGLTGTTLGLLVSACAKNQDMATILVPIVLIPQIILANVVCNLEDKKWAKGLAQALISVFWSNRGLTTCFDADTRQNNPVVYESNPKVAQAVVVLALHAMACVVGTIVWMYVQDRSQGWTRSFKQLFQRGHGAKG